MGELQIADATNAFANLLVAVLLPPLRFFGCMANKGLKGERACLQSLG
jgi:hypothetical protein